MTIENYIALFITMFVVAAIPGPAVFTIVSASITDGFKRGAYMTAGLILADYVFILLAISGLAYVAEILGNAFVVIKYLCAAYLVWIGLSLFLSRPSTAASEQSAQNHHSAIIIGFLLTLSNPKAIMFYVALFPAFVNVQSVSVTDVLGIMACATLAFGSVNLAFAYTSSKASKFVSPSNKSGILRKCAGAIMAGAGITVAARA